MQVRFGFLPQLRRDAAMLWRELRGDVPAPFHARKATRATAAASALATRRLRVAAVRRETADAVTLLLDDPTGAELTWQPGQFFTLLLRLPDGTELRRAYSAAMPPSPGAPLPLTVKRQPDGRGSGFLHERVRAGDVLEVLGPSGQFVVPADAQARPLVLVGGGSGITPLSAILHAALASGDGPPVTLIYANRRVDDVIFAATLAELAAAHPARFSLRHVTGPGFDAASVPVVADAEYFVCGPAPLMDATRAFLLAQGVPAARVHLERFASPAASAADDAATRLPQPILVRLASGAARTVVAAPGQTLLEAGLAAGLPMPYSCAMGGCGACRVTLAAGTVAASDDGGLTAEERARGLVLACSSRPTSPCTLEVPA